MPLRIAMLTNTYPPIVGGVSTAVVRSATGLRRLGHQVLVVAPSVVGEVAEPWVVRVPALPVLNSGFFAPLSSSALHRLLHRFAPHVIHVHHPWLAGATGRSAAKAHRVPLLFTYHTMYEAFAHVVGPGADERAVGAMAVAAADAFVRTVDVVIAPSVSTAQVLAQRGHDRRRIRVCPGGVDVAAMSRGARDETRAKLGIPLDAFVFGHLGRLSAEKGLDVLSAAVAEAMRQLPRSWCLIAGDGPARAAMQRTLSVANTRFLGSVAGRGIADAYSAMDLFVFTSLNDTQGLVLIEAMAAGMPVVAVNAPGAKDVVDGENGVLVVNDAEAISAQLVSYATDRERLRRGQRGARGTAEAMSIEAAANGLEAIYYEAIEARGL
jgi:glycosyltransferase involved in cell wall biosynthesis